jgi:hypothetical protein
MPVDLNLRNVGLSLAALALAGGSIVAYKALEGGGTAPACHWVTGVELDGGAESYVLVHTRGDVLDGGSPGLPSNVTLLDVQEDATCTGVDGGEDLQVWAASDPTAPWPCACSSGSACQVPGLPFDLATMQPIPNPPPQDAPLGQTLQPGWVGAGCVRKACVELAGGADLTWPTGCPLPPP